MTNTEKLNIIIKTQFNNVTVGVTPTTFYDESYIAYKITSNSTQCELSNNTKRIKISNSNASKLYLDTVFSTFKTVDFSTDIVFDITTLTADNTICSISTNSATPALNFRIFIRNTYEKGITISANGWTISANYQFVINKKYVLSFTKKDDVYQLYIDGVSIGYKYSPTFTNNIITGSYYFIIGSSNMSSTSTSTSILNGNIYSFNYSIGPSLIHNQGFSHYGKNLISNLKFGNNGTDTSTTFYMGIETIYNAGVNWTLPTLVVNNGNLKLNGVPLSTNYTGKFTLDFNINSNTSQTSNIISYLGVYQLNMNIVGSGLPDPSVIVNTNTKSALDFENGIIDQIGTTVWTKEGTANVTSVNKIFGENSFETKALGDSLSTTSNIITGGGIPFTIEFYALIKSGSKGVSSPYQIYPLFSKANNVGAGEQFFYIDGSLGNKLALQRQSNAGTIVTILGGQKNIRLNEINKFTFTYDSSSLRLFINDKIDSIAGTLNGFVPTTSEPYRFLRNYVSSYSGYESNTLGLIDNINIHDGIATKVRDPDPYEEYLVVDLAFDGENNSTKIVDNGGGDVLRSANPYNNNIISLLHFDNNINDATGRLWSNTSFEFNNTDSVFGGYSGNRNISSSSIYTSKTNDDFKWSTQNYTIEMFVKVISSTYTPLGNGRSDMICSTNDGDSLYDWGFGINERNKLSFAYWGGAQYLVEGVNTFNDNNWHHIAMVNDGSTIKLFADGILEAHDAIKGTPSDSSVPIRIGASNSFSNHKFLIDELCITKGIAKYKTNFNIPITQFQHIPKNKWTVSGGAKISTDQKFDGFSSLYLDGNGDYIETSFSDLFVFDKSETTISFNVMFSLLPTINGNQSIFIASWDSNNNRRSFFYLLEKTTYGFNIAFSTSPNGLAVTKQIIFNVNFEINKNYKLDLNISSTNVSLFVNGKLINTVENILSNQFIDNVDRVRIGSHLNNSSYLNGYIKNFKIYKGVAVIPESPTGKIQLDFDNNVTDKYNNSTWTNSGVTFDQVNSVKGYAAYFNDTNIVSNFSIKTNNVRVIFDYMSNTASYNTIMKNSNNDSNAFMGIDSNSCPYMGNNVISTQKIYINNYYNHEYIGLPNLTVYKLNNVLVAQSNNFTERHGVNISLHGVPKSYMDNFKIYNNPIVSETVIDKPAVHLPLETNAINTGFTPLTINSVGSPTYTTIDGKKCIKFENGKYLSINSNNIFNLGTSSDFYIEVMLYPNNSSISQWFLSDGEWVYGSTYIGITTDNKIYFTVYNTTSLVLTSSNEIIRNSWNTVKLFRKNNIVFIEVNSILTEYKNINAIINFTYKNTYIGQYSTNGSDNLNGYMSNFKMFVGTSEIPETYNDKKVLDLDFKPTRKSYLFKDNNNKCVIHPVNITQRDYQDSQYCCTFNGTNQYLQLGKNDLFNFGLDDFVINIKFNSTSTTGWRMIMCDNASSTNFIDIDADYKLLAIKLGGSRYDTPRNSIMPNTVYNVIIQVINSILTVKINDIQSTLDGLPSQLVSNVNFNLSSNTFIGSYLSTSEYFQGQIYSIKVLRNTSDITLLNPPVLAFNKTYTLTNGVDSLSMDFDNADQTVRFINDENTVSAIINDLPLTVDKVDTIGNTDNLILFNDYIGTSSDIKMYDTVLTDNDTFVYDGPYDPEFGEVEIIKPEIQEFMLFDTGNYTVDMYVEGYRDHELFLYNDELQVVVDTAIDRLIHPYIEQNYLYEYSLNDSVTGKKYKIIDMGAPGDYTVLIDSRVCLDSDFCVRVYRHDTGNFIGQYELNKSVTPYSVTIPNLDTTKTYDIMLFDKNTMVESRMMSDRSPTPY